MTKARRKKNGTVGQPTVPCQATPPAPCPEAERLPDEVRRILWGIASDSEESGTARTAACRLLLMDARERDEGGEVSRHDVDLNKRALALMRRVAN
jgi:hypothetical protein